MSGTSKKALFAYLKRPRVFLSYRRKDSQAITDRLYDHLVARLGKRNVFKDVDTIEGGANISEEISRAIGVSSAVVALIGSEWEGLESEQNIRRIDLPDDWVRIEIKEALESGSSVIPVLVNGREMLPDDLPFELQSLAHTNFLQLRADPDFKRDRKRLLRTVGFRWWHRRKVIIAVFMALLLMVPVYWFYTEGQIRQWDRVMVANFSTDQWDAADVIADRILARRPDHLRALSVKGSTAALSGEYRTALKYFQRAYDLDPENRAVRRNLAYAMLQSGRANSAVELYESLRNGTGSAEYSVACAYVAAARYEDALRVLRNLPDTLLSPKGGSPVGQVPVLEAAALMGRSKEGDTAAAVEKLKFAIAQNSSYWLPILNRTERDPQNDYRIQMELLEPILENVLRSFDSS